MALSALHTYLVRRTFIQLVSHDEEVLGLFSERLGPTLLRSLTADEETQPHRFLETLALLIALLDDPATLRAQLKVIEAQQWRHQIKDEQVRQAGAALLWVIERQMGDSFTGDIQNAWVQFFRFLAALIAGSAS